MATPLNFKDLQSLKFKKIIKLLLRGFEKLPCVGLLSELGHHGKRITRRGRKWKCVYLLGNVELLVIYFFESFF